MVTATAGDFAQSKARAMSYRARQSVSIAFVMMRLLSIACLICLSSACASRTHLADGAQQWPETYIAELPPSLHKIARNFVLVDAATIERLETRLAERDAGERRELLTAIAINTALESRQGVLALLNELHVSDDPVVRIAIADAFAEQGARFGIVDPYRLIDRSPPIKDAYALAPDVSRAIETALVKTESPAEAAALARSFIKLQQRRLVLSLSLAIKKAAQSDQAGADTLRLLYNEFWLPGALPDFYYRRFASVKAPTNTEEVLRVLAFGDFGTGDAAQMKTAASMRDSHNERPFHFGLTLGDNFYPEGLDDPEHFRWKTEWEDLYGKMAIPFYPTLGNHDYYADGAALAELEYSANSESWDMPAPNYVVRAGLADFFALDTNILLEDQLQWLRSALTESDAPWKVVYGHHPIFYSGGQSDVEPNDMVGRLLPVLLEGGANVWLNGHDHAMEEYSSVGALHFFTIGSGGAIGSRKPEDEKSLFRSEEHGFGVLEFTDSALTVKFIRSDGTVIHETEIEK